MADCQIGECRIRTVWTPDGTRKFYIDQADEHIRIAHEVLETIEHPDVSYGDGILTLRGINRTVSYGVGSLDSLSMTHEAWLSPEAASD